MEGREHLKIYHAVLRNPGEEAHQSPAERHFCGECGSALWLWDPRWPEMVHPFASAVDSELPAAPERTHLMLEFKARWVPLAGADGERQHLRYPEESIADWHERLGLLDEST